MSTNSTSSTNNTTERTETDATKTKFDAVNKKTLEEDDEFEDFPVDNWPAQDTLKEVDNIQDHLWVENWDDVEVEDDFTNELKNELEKYKQEHQQK
ncbi:hypothetical protein NCAS_0F03320 [Naumovozyma castellii]|uniref:26S proteasome complex subunit SEM1 n=1 Tax=Naumovozyma castellii TaxID=27288 RepID=G0VH44_NAUCA|nr:hypothetical protein NCAS_0F03320 [Naumovozyma castellii CBS 4309]CCC70816.1 hypothetical protein NCAS_0F03320 [Naumovozyma castellii CBS 4309]